MEEICWEMLSGSTPEGSEGSWVGQREELNSDEVVTGTSVILWGALEQDYLS